MFSIWLTDVLVLVMGSNGYGHDWVPGPIHLLPNVCICCTDFICSWLVIQAASHTVHCMTGIQFEAPVAWQYSLHLHIPASVCACSIVHFTTTCTHGCSLLFIMSFYFSDQCGTELSGWDFNTCCISTTTCTGWTVSKLLNIIKLLLCCTYFHCLLAYCDLFYCYNTTLSWFFPHSSYFW